MKKNILLLIFAAGLLSSCISMNKVTYLHGAEELVNSPQRIDENYTIRIKKGDVIHITVTNYNEENVKPFKNSAQVGSAQSGTNGYQGFLVDAQGCVDVPYAGRITAAGKTTSQVADEICRRLVAEGYMKEPNVNVRLADFRISVLGEVSSPGEKTVTGERVTLLQAISMAGDLLPTARRDSVLVVREDRGLRTAYCIDLTRSEDVFSSPVYYLQQNDVIYVKPNKSMRVRGSSTFTTLGAASSVISIIASVVALVVAFTR